MRALIWTGAIVLSGTVGGTVKAQTTMPGLPLPAAVTAGFKIMTDRGLGNCIACHAIPGHAGVPSTFGPSLAGIGQRYDGPTLKQWVTDARKLQPGTVMPPFGTTQGTQSPNSSQPILSGADIDLVVAALQSLH